VRRVPSRENDGITEWFPRWLDDPESKRVLVSKSFVKRDEEMAGHVRL
jgi:hypothetical protein